MSRRRRRRKRMAAVETSESATAVPDTPDRPRRWRRRLVRLLLWMLPVGLAVGAAVVWEMRTSAFQSRYFSAIGREVGWSVEPGPAHASSFPRRAR